MTLEEVRAYYKENISLRGGCHAVTAEDAQIMRLMREAGFRPFRSGEPMT